MRSIILIGLIFVISCSTPQRQYELLHDDCEEYNFTVRFINDLILAPYKFEESLKLYPMYLSDSIIKEVNKKLEAIDLQISMMYQEDRSSVRLTDQFCGEVGEKDGLHNPDYFNKVILLKFEIKQHNKFIYVKFIQKYPKMYCELKEFEITEENRELEKPKE